jgi:hypothetical protein
MFCLFITSNKITKHTCNIYTTTTNDEPHTTRNINTTHVSSKERITLLHKYALSTKTRMHATHYNYTANTKCTPRTHEFTPYATPCNYNATTHTTLQVNGHTHSSSVHSAPVTSLDYVNIISM